MRRSKTTTSLRQSSRLIGLLIITLAVYGCGSSDGATFAQRPAESVRDQAVISAASGNVERKSTSIDVLVVTSLPDMTSVSRTRSVPSTARITPTSTSTSTPTSTSTSSPAATSNNTTATTSTESGPIEDDQAVTIAFGGDIHFEGRLADALAADPTEALAPIGDMMAEADLAIANLETAVTERGAPSPKHYNFRAPPSAFDALRAAGIDVVSVANNHGMDYGAEGLADTLRYAAEANFPVVGIGQDAKQAYAPFTAQLKGQRIAVIGATQVLDSSLIPTWTATDTQPGLASAKDVDALVGTVKSARAGHDTVVVYLHWGIEGQTCPAPRQKQLADQLVAAGADIIVGGHAHRLQGGGFKQGAFIHYGLGNFVFYTDSGPGTDSGVLTVTIKGRQITGHEWIPAQLQNGVATRLDDESATEAARTWNELRACTDLQLTTTGS